MARKVLSVLLSVLMVFSVLTPLGVVFAESETLLIVASSDNGSTGDNSHARAAIANLRQTGDTWYSAMRSQCTPPPSHAAVATFTLGKAADVEGVSIAFYKADERTQTFSVEYSEDGIGWDPVLTNVVSSLQNGYVEGSAENGYTDGVHPAEYFEFESPVYAKELRVILTGTTIVNTGASTDYSAFHSFEAVGEYDPDAEAEAADYSAVYAAIAAAGALDSSEYTAASWADLESVIGSVDYSLDCFDQAIVDSIAEGIYSAIDDLEFIIPEIKPTYAILHGKNTSANQDPLYGPEAALQDNAYWCCAGASSDFAEPEIIYVLPVESVLSNVKIRWYSANARTYTFGIRVSVDGENWTTVYDDDSTQSVPADNTETFNYPLNGVHAAYLKLIGINNTGDNTTKIAFSRIRVFGEEVEGGFVPPKPRADYSTLDNYKNVLLDLHEDLYTEESWQAVTDLIDGFDENLTITEQDEVNQYAEDLKSAINGLIFNELSEIQIAQAYWSEGAVGSPAWTNGAMIITEPEYTLMSYKMFTNSDHTSSMGIPTWTRIFCVPTDDAVIDPETGMYDQYEIVNIKGNLDNATVPVTGDE
ncbi:MAG: discoidin domain-containing protein, partial [Clostridia bacterium]|nr:discoidin domain-containing protein [Clostridia bacterium]